MSHQIVLYCTKLLQGIGGNLQICIHIPSTEIQISIQIIFSISISVCIVWKELQRDRTKVFQPEFQILI